jgi:CRISPR-associated endonuclease/helicase Cas3
VKEADSEFIARFRESDGTPQSLIEHLEGASALASRFAAKVGLSEVGALIGLLHDFGKYSKDFQSYIKSSQGKLEPDDDEYVDASNMRGKIDHSTAGAQYLLAHRGSSRLWQIAADIMALCVASHHSGLIDCISPDGTDVFSKRMRKPNEKTHFDEVEKNLENRVRSRVQQLLTSSIIEDELQCRFERLQNSVQSLEVDQFMLGFLGRFLFSALIDADRLNSAEREPMPALAWRLLTDKLEDHISAFKPTHRIDAIRRDISSSCLKFAGRERGFFQLTVPTGGGKTLASLRFALHHAAKNKMDRIIFVVPYTSIIDQNARVARSVFATLEEGDRQVVLEHHSNLTSELDTSQSKLLAENWDAPIIYTTAVQFLETLFASGTRGVRRLHQLANSIIIFDEVQTIPIRTVHLFNNAINFLVGQCGATIVFSTATQPLMDKVDSTKGAALLSDDSQMMTDVGGLFRDLHRAKIEDKRRDGGWTVDDVADVTMQELAESGSVLVIVNKKAQARELYQRLHGKIEHIYHLSTSMCPTHRMIVLDKIKVCLDSKNPSPVVCISTQLIEAGVDVDFGSVIRYLAGLDSVAQAAGRCNRNGLRQTGRVLIVNLANEDLARLEEIREAQKQCERVLGEYKENPAAFDHDLQGPKAMERYYFYYFFQRSHEMAFPVSRGEFGRDDDLLTLLSTNTLSVEAYKASQHQAPPLHFRQSFMSAAKAFKAIDSPTEGIIVPYGEGVRIIAELSASSRFDDKSKLLKEAQRYSVNLFPHEMTSLKKKNRLYEAWEGSGIYCLYERYYSGQFGVSIEEVAGMKTLIV